MLGPSGGWVPTLSAGPCTPPRGAHLGIYQMIQVFSPVLKQEGELGQTITVTLAGLGCPCDLQKDNSHPQQQLLCLSGL